MNVLTFDIEEWFIEKEYGGNRKEKYAEYDAYLDKILSLLNNADKRATFFCVGKMAVEFPEVIKKIADEGHEIGCHSNIHTWLNKMTYDDAFQDTSEAVNSLEQCIGKKVLSYRAPAFSIGENNKWAFDILAECGIKRDSSIFPAMRDFGGFSSFGHKEPVLLTHNGILIKEFPICTTSIFGKEFVYSGGGYFRFFPLWFVKNEMKKSPYSMCYFHIGDLLPETNGVLSRKAYENYFKEKGSMINRYKRYFKSNLGKEKAWNKLKNLVHSFDFVNIDNVDKTIDWSKCNHKVL